ncbi:MAG: hypothetical protein A3K46_02580 [Chloroflexi bacterium RBG_13_60_9]|nr:MAG: hypothetical protein A3K46_02580 [Chloroflexi bacterium RBG_13_60_9]
MDATSILMEEHRIIEHVLAAMEIQAARLQGESAVRTEFFLDAVDFFRNFVDGCHHRKEEEALFVALIDAGLTKDNSPIGILIAEHEQGREYNRKIEKAARIVIGGGSEARAELAQTTEEYVSLLYQHIQKEDGELFPKADELIPAEVQDELAAEFKRIEKEEIETGVHEKYHKLAETLADEASG